MSKIKVGDTVVIGKGHSLFNEDEEVKVIEVDKRDGEIPYKCSRANGEWSWVKVGRIKSSVSKCTKNQRITSLEEKAEQQQNEINELKVIVHQLRENGLPSSSMEGKQALIVSGVDYGTQPGECVIEFEGKQYKKVDREAREGDVVVYPKVKESWVSSAKANKPYLVTLKNSNGRPLTTLGNVYGDSPGYDDIDKVLVYEVIPQELQKQTVEPKSPNQLRAEIIEKAKVFIVESGDLDGDYEVKNIWWCKAEFVVNEEKRTVVALMHGINSGKIRTRGIAKCMPSDVFNEHIGRAIALGRALGLDVSEFEQAVQPNEPRTGMVVRLRSGEEYRLLFNHKHLQRGEQIINDTSAKYGGVE